MMALGRVHLFMGLFVVLTLAMAGRVVYLNAAESDFLQNQGDAH